MQAELRRLRDLLDQQQGYKNFQRLEAEVRGVQSVFCLPFTHCLKQCGIRVPLMGR